ncbi:sugar phosphate isomerase/epimerase family protein [Saccharopolyspora mangrovi]|uniref:Sugar phosphate isomerase/epimerase family protein n=1 Tax=Saccharopolyspora mangrovi TaxID=3082379 RepID=A0ABU6A7J5_9PSEU|nr:sugar phosphate isomerase/epimerase family protein [Saccharopolyspora sp. S2-29]MEB3367456.1 sugar phosphate isomerase/epimerase family protein [Saccharopolyspora sp. S2-29]
MCADQLAGIGDEAAASLPDQIAAITALGWPGIELRTVDGVALADLDSSRFQRVRRAVAAAGLRVVCLDSRIGNWSRPITAPPADDLRELDVLADRCAALGTRYIRVMSYLSGGLDESEWRSRVLDRIALLADRAARHGVVLLHENCSGWAGSDPDRMMRLVEAGGPCLRLLFDVGNGIEHGYDSFGVLERVLPHVEHVHVKDAVGAPGRAEYVLPGEGHARVHDCLRLLLDRGYSGAFSLEPHLVTRPHEGRTATDPGPFLSAGRRLEHLLRAAPTGVA